MSEGKVKGAGVVAGGMPPVTDPQRMRFWIASLLSLSGLLLLFMGFWVPPIGVIHRSVLLAYGEVMTFVGALIGIDYVARERIRKVCHEE